MSFQINSTLEVRLANKAVDSYTNYRDSQYRAEDSSEVRHYCKVDNHDRLIVMRKIFTRPNTNAPDKGTDWYEVCENQVAMYRSRQWDSYRQVEE